MERTGYIEIRVVGRKGNFDLTPENYDITDIMSILEQSEKLLFPSNKKERPTISYDIESGSVKHILKTSLQAIIGFNALLFQIENNNYSIDFLEPQTARAFEVFHETAKKQDVSFEITTSVENPNRISINKETEFVRAEELWAEAEFYFYGLITDIGGKGKANVHLDTKELGLLKIDADKTMLREYESNPLYKRYGVRALGKQNVSTGDVDKSSLRLVEIIDYDPSFKEDYIKGLINRARKSWDGINDADEWLSELR